jgi:hypothetical protein
MIPLCTRISPIDSQFTVTKGIAIEHLNGFLCMGTVLEDHVTKPATRPSTIEGYIPTPQRSKLEKKTSELLWAALLRQVIHTHKTSQEPKTP